MFERRKNMEAYVDGEYYTVKRPIYLGKTARTAGSVAVTLPKEWLDSIGYGKQLHYFLLDVKDTMVVVKPYFERIPELEPDIEGGDGNGSH